MIKISVRNLVEFILRSGDIDNTGSGASDAELMRMGTKLHKKIQKSMGINYSSEYPLSHTFTLSRDGMDFEICVDGRADGIIKPDESQSALKSYIEIDGEVEDRSLYIIDEIKGVMRDVDDIREPVTEHLGQAKCYAYFFACDNGLEQIKVRITYCNLETEKTKYFTEIYDIDELKTWYEELLNEYAKWAKFSIDHKEVRDKAIEATTFPFEYRTGQKDMIASVYTSIVREKKIYIEAPTGIGKTLSTVYPSVKAMGEGRIEKIFYLTAKTITRTAALNAFTLLKEHGLTMKTIVLTAKDKVCILDKPECNPRSCERAKGHFDRVNDAVFDLITHEDDISRDKVLEYAAKHNVCPFEMGLDAALWTDAIIGDYNYVFDPDVYLRRFFVNDKKNDYVFLVDEAHNLVDRARRMYSAVLVKEDFLTVKKIVMNVRPKLADALNKANKELLSMKRECDGLEVMEISRLNTLYIHLLRVMSEYDRYFKEKASADIDEKVTQLFFDIRKFMNAYDYLDENYIVYDEIDEKGDFYLNLLCMNPSVRLSEYLCKGKCSVFFSATLIPVNYYRSQLASKDDDYAVYIPSPFETDKRLIMIARDVSTKYTRRTKGEYEKIVGYINDFTGARRGNYMVFFPSYKMMDEIYSLICDMAPHLSNSIVCQTTDMTEEDREDFLEAFSENAAQSHIGFCVMGGIFSEGIDLVGDRLIGAVIVGTGLPMVCNERELFRGYYDDDCNKGFEFAYLYDGMNKVMQSAGRVIRTKDDKGAILLLDERFIGNSYRELFPREWYPHEVVDRSRMNKLLGEFW